MENDKYIAVVATLLSGIELKMIKKLGYKSLLINSNTWISMDKALESDACIEINLNDAEEVMNKIEDVRERYNIVSVFSFNEYRVPIVARIRESLGLPYGIPYQAAVNCRNKKLTRKILENLGDEAVKYRTITSLEEAKAFVKVNGLPVVIKPSNDAGSENIFCCKTEEDVVLAVEKLKNTEVNLVDQKLDEEFLIEEFLDGPEYSVEAMAYDGSISIIAITEKKVISPFEPIEIGHTVPAMVSQNNEEKIKDIVTKANELLGVNYTVTHTEVKLTSKGPRIVEVNARIGGDNIASLVEAAKGINLYEASILLSMGRMPVVKEPVTDKASIRYFYAEKDGFAEIKNIPLIEKNPNVKELNIQISEGAKMAKTISNFNRYGYFICYDESDENMDEMQKNVSSNGKEKMEIEKEECSDTGLNEIIGNYCTTDEMNDALNDIERSVAGVIIAFLGDDDYMRTKAVIKAKYKGVSSKKIAALYKLTELAQKDLQKFITNIL